MKHENGFEVIVNDRIDRYAVEIWLFERIGEKLTNYNTNGDSLIATTVQTSETTEGLTPLITLPLNMAKPFIEAFLEYNNKSGLRTNHENRLEGQLAATKEHLSDMREFAKKLLDASIHSAH